MNDTKTMPSGGLVKHGESSTSPSATAVDHKSFQKPVPRVLPDEVSVASLATEDSPSSQKLVELLTQVVKDDSDQETLRQHRAAIAVLNHLLLLDSEAWSDQAKLSANLEGPQQLEAVKRALNVSKYPQELEACEVASPETSATIARNHQKELKMNDARCEPIIYPIPPNEEIRMATIEHFSLPDVLNVPELNVICSLAAAEVKCPHGIVTLVERDIVSLLATNNPKYWAVGSGNPREHSFCQHFIMHEKPLLVSHAESDPLFQHIAPVTKLNLQFYAGFPLTVSRVISSSGQSDKVIVGALCCLDETPRDMTRSQYWRLVKLAKAASKILEKAAEENRAKTQEPEVETR